MSFTQKHSQTRPRHIVFDAAYVHIYGPGTRRHIKNAFKAGARVDEIMEVLVRQCGGGAV